MKKYLFILVGITLLSCSSGKPSLPDNKIYDTEWQLASVLLSDGSKKLYVSVSKIDIVPSLMINKETRRVSGSSGCNRFSSNANIQGNSIKFDQLAMTRMLCMNDNGLEASVVKALDIVNNYTIKGNKLILKRDKKIIAEYIKNIPLED